MTPIKHLISETIIERIWSRVIRKDSGCIEWTRSTNGRGYGQIRLSRSVIAQVHRVTAIHAGVISESDFGLHSCDNPLCVNPEHIFPGDQKANMQDAANKGRIKVPNGESHPRTKLTWNLVRKIRSAKGTTRNIGEEFGITSGQVSRIKNNIFWKEKQPTQNTQCH